MPRPLLSILAAIVAPILFILGQPIQAADQNLITIGTGGVTGVYYPSGGAICRLLNKDRKTHGFHCRAESTDGSAYNINAIRNGQLDLGLVQSDIQFNAYHGTGKFAGTDAYASLRSIFSLHTEQFTVVAREDSGIKHIDDLKGKRVNIGNPGSGQRATMEVLMKAKGWDTGVFSQVLELKSPRQPSALCQNKIDAMVFTVGHPSNAIKQATDLCNSRLVEVTGKEIDQLVAKHSYYRAAVIPGNMYRGNKNNVDSFSLSATVVTSANTRDELVYAIVKAVFDNFEEFKQLHPALANLDKKQMVSEGLSASLHPGAIKYYKEAGLL